MWDEYGEDLKSDIADLKNISGGRGAGTITGAMISSFWKSIVDEYCGLFYDEMRFIIFVLNSVYDIK